MALEAENAELRARLAQNSSNSSRPPSSDPPGTPPRGKGKRKGKRRRRGGQPGHPGHHRELLPPDQVDAIVDHVPESCWRCGRAVAGRDPEPRRHQVTEVTLTSHTTEHREHRIECGGCGAVNEGDLPVAVRESPFGPRLTIVVGRMAGVYRLSQRRIEQLLSDLFNVRISLGSISRLEHRVSESVAPAVAEAARAIPQAPALHADETSWREARRKAWLWVVTTTQLAVFAIRKSRGATIARELLDGFRGILCSDRWSGYAWVDAARRQLCWAHLKRDFLSFEDHGPAATILSQALGRQRRAMMRLWHRVRDGTLDRSDFQKRMRPIQARILSLLRQGRRLPPPRVAGKCREILKLEGALFTFVRHTGVDPTNNAAERALRHAVIWRKTSFGTDSQRGSRFVERMLTVVTSLRLQRRNVLAWLTDAYDAKLHRRPGPSLLPLIQDQPLAMAA